MEKNRWLWGQGQIDDDESQLTLMKQAVREVLDEAAPGQLGAGVGTTVVNINAEVDPDSFKDMVKEASREHEEETLEDYNEGETALMQKAVTSIVTSDEFQDLMKKVVKVALYEREQEANLRALRRELNNYY